MMDIPADKSSTRYLVFAASMRAASLNEKLAQLAARMIRDHSGIVDFASIQEFDCPSYNQDIEDSQGVPAPAQEFCRRIAATDALVISSPEYNASMPGLLKNVIDWASRMRPQPFSEHHALLMSASPSMAGGNRGLWSLRIPLEHLGARVYPDMFSLATAHQALNGDGDIVNSVLRQRFENNIASFMSLVEAAKHYPCIKKAWVEFLGEQPDPAKDRVEHPMESSAAKPH
jgi:NAD(P)H-dependent FMN reductase